jgi:aminomuconate-semialdehyde/2-hydroxymuconate-6-semialdehyde dehydrogenase
VLSYYEKARAEGATVVTGGGVPAMSGALAEGHWVQPTIWTGLPETAAVVREEIFGPCCHIAPFDTEEEAIALANANDYWLATTGVDAGPRPRAPRRAAHRGRHLLGQQLVPARLAHRVRWRQGLGHRTRGRVHSLEFYTELRNVCIKL